MNMFIYYTLVGIAVGLMSTTYAVELSMVV